MEALITINLVATRSNSNKAAACKQAGTLRDKKSGFTIFQFMASTLILSAVLALTLFLSQIMKGAMHLQVAGDGSVMGAAALQASGYNIIAEKNNEAVKLNKLHREIVWRYGVPYANYNSGQQAARLNKLVFENRNRLLNLQQIQTNIQYAKKSQSEARSLSRLNAPGTQLVLHLSDYGQLAPLRKLTGTTEHYSFLYWQETPYGRIILYARGPQVSTKVYKKRYPNIHTYLCGELVHPRVKPAVNVGSSGYQDLRTVSTAMPSGGILWDEQREEARPDYRPKLVRTGDVNPRPAVPESTLNF